MKYSPLAAFLIVLNVLTLPAHAQTTGTVLTKQQADEDFKWLRYSLEYCHPRLYKFEDKATVDGRFDSVQHQLTENISGADFLHLISRVNASVRCGHLYTIPQDDLAKQILSQKVLPFYIQVLQDKLYLVNNCSNYKIPNGSAIVSINGKSSSEILAAILPFVAADGFIETRKRRLIERYLFPSFQGFDLYYYLHVDRKPVFVVEYTHYATWQKKTVTLNGITREERRERLLKKYRLDELEWFKTPSPAIEINKDSNYALIKLPRSFYNDKMDPNYDSVLNTTFHAIREKGISNLVLDLRNNEGGSEDQQAELMSYIYDQPFKLYQNIFVSRLDYRPLQPIIHALEKDTSRLLDKNEDEWMRKIADNLWINNYEYYKALQLQPPKKDVYQGKIYVLINGACFSSAAALAANIRNTTKAIFIGEESGGLYEGPTGGQTIPVILPNSRIMVRISPNIHIGYMYQKHPFGRGVFPDYPITYTIADVIGKKDLEMIKVKELIRGR